MGDNLTMTTINKQISLGTDDCCEVGDTTVTLGNTQVYVGYVLGVYDVGLRWQSINIAQGSTINSATLSLSRAGGTGTLAANVRGIDEDNTATWSDGSRPSQRTKTTATISADQADWGNWGVGWITLSITSVIQEIINRSGWSANNALAIVIEDAAGAGSNYAQVYAYEQSGNVSGAKLDIDYSTGGGTSIPVLVHQYQQQGIS